MTDEEKLICDYLYHESFKENLIVQARMKKFHGLTPKVQKAIEVILETKTKEQFYKEMVERIVKDHNSKLNRCPKCNEIARTDKAKQCRFCSHDWH